METPSQIEQVLMERVSPRSSSAGAHSRTNIRSQRCGPPPWGAVGLTALLLGLSIPPHSEAEISRLGKDQVQALSRELVVGQPVRSFCSSCRDAVFEELVIETIEFPSDPRFKRGTPFYLEINNQVQYPDRLYVHRDGKWCNLARVSGLDRGGEPEFLDLDLLSVDAVTGVQGYYVGTIGSRLRIQMDLLSPWSPRWQASYFYEGVGEPLQVSVRTVRALPGEPLPGKPPKFALELSESEPPTGFFRGVLDPSEGIFQGIWSNPASSKSHSFQVRRVATITFKAWQNGEGSHSQSHIRFEERAGVWQALNYQIELAVAEYSRQAGPADSYEAPGMGDSREQSVAFYSESLVCLQTTYMYWGGAHPNTFYSGQCYVQPEGYPISLDLRTVFLESDEAFSVLEEILRRSLARVERIERGDIQGLWIIGSGLRVCILRDTIGACWANIAEHVTVPLAALGRVIDPEGPLGRWGAKSD